MRHDNVDLVEPTGALVRLKLRKGKCCEGGWPSRESGHICTASAYHASWKSIWGRCLHEDLFLAGDHSFSRVGAMQLVTALEAPYYLWGKSPIGTFTESMILLA